MDHSLIDLLSLVPSVVWSGLIASIVTLGGVMISNASNTKRLLKQLEHDADQKERDRLNNLRKEVYLKAAEETAKVGGFFARIPSIDPVTQNIGDGLSEFQSASAKLQLVAQPEAVALARELNVKYGEILLQLLKESTPIHHINIQIKISDSFFEKNQTEASRIIAEMKQINESGKNNSEKFIALKNSLDESQSLADHFSKKRAELYRLHETSLKSYTTELMEQIKLVVPLQDALMVAIRKELDLVSYPEKIQQTSQSKFYRLFPSLKRLTYKPNSQK